MELTVLGSGTSIPSLERGSPGHLLRTGSTVTLLDSGPGTLLRILRAGAGLEEITHILYSHSHPDHTADLAPLLFASHNPCSPRRAPLTIGGSAGFLAFFERLSGAYGNWIEAVTFPLRLVELTPGRTELLGDLAVDCCQVPHIPSSLAYRLADREGRSLVYSGDTGESEDLSELARGCGLLLIEASFPDGEGVEGHLTPSLAGRIAARARPGLVLLTHFYPPCESVDMMEQLRRTYDGEAEMARDLMRRTP